MRPRGDFNAADWLRSTASRPSARPEATVGIGARAAGQARTRTIYGPCYRTERISRDVRAADATEQGRICSRGPRSAVIAPGRSSVRVRLAPYRESAVDAGSFLVALSVLASALPRYYQSWRTAHGASLLDETGHFPSRRLSCEFPYPASDAPACPSSLPSFSTGFPSASCGRRACRNATWARYS
jgi:hypothetical protein